MSMPIIHHVSLGETFGHCVITETGLRVRNKNGHMIRACRLRCECGVEFAALLSNVCKGNTKSCGCRSRNAATRTKTVHGCAGRQERPPLYVCWANMKARCDNPKSLRYANYGGRGITVCDDWRESFVAFKEWAIKAGYQPGLTLERKDVNLSYCPENCCFIPMERQPFNTTRNHLVSCFEETKTVSEWARDSRCV